MSGVSMYKDENYYTLVKRSNGIWSYYCYSEDGKRVLRSTNQQKRSKALEVVQQRITEGTLVNPKGCSKKYLKKDLIKYLEKSFC